VNLQETHNVAVITVGTQKKTSKYPAAD